MAGAEDFQRDWLAGDGPLAEATRQVLIDAEVLRRHPWPAPVSG